jgi:DNA-directed RNA polymerase beta' subunit
MSRFVSDLNKNQLRIDNHEAYVERLLWSLQREWNELYAEIDAILSGKKGNVRLLSGGRCNFSGRSVIIQNPKLRADQVILPYPWLVITLQQQIINVIVKTYGLSYDDARNRWYKAIDTPDKTIVQIIYGLIKSRKEGLPIIINRNPSIQRGSLLQMFCIDMSFNYTMSLPLAVLVPLAADSTIRRGHCYRNIAA